MTGPILLSGSPEQFSRGESLGVGIEAKLDWKHKAALSGDTTLSDDCEQHGLAPEAITSIHLPPGTSQPQGLSVGPRNVGDIIDFIHSVFGSRVDPDWLTVHTTRSFDYRAHVDRLATITEQGGYPLAVENTPDASCYYTPEDIAAMAYLIEQVPRLSDVSILIDTAHVDMEQRSLTLEATAVESELERADAQLRDQPSGPFQEFLQENVNQISDEPDLDVAPSAESSPWRPVFVTLAIVGGAQIQAIHLNDPRSDGLPDTNRPEDGLRWVLSYCDHHDIVVVLEPVEAHRKSIVETIEGLPVVS